MAHPSRRTSPNCSLGRGTGTATGWHRDCLWTLPRFRRAAKRFRLFNFTLTLVSKDPATLSGVRDYLRSSVASLTSASRLEHLSEETTHKDAIVLFADDYPSDEIVRRVPGLASKLVVIVTARAHDFDALRERTDVHPRITIVSRPTWGWVLLDAIRAGMGTDPEGR